MKSYLIPSLRLTLVLILLCTVIYPLLIWGIAQLSEGSGEGVKVNYHGMNVGYENVGQKFTDDHYFWGRPSAVEYNAAGAGGSNKGPSNPDYLATVETRIDTFLVHNPDIDRKQIPAELVTASGSGLDPHISVEAAKIQVPRVAKARNISEDTLYQLIDRLTEEPLFGFLGTAHVNVLKLNIELNVK